MLWRNEFQLAKLLSLKRNLLWKEGVQFDQLNVSERRTESKNLKGGNFYNQWETSSVPYDPKWQMNHPEDSGNLFALQKTEQNGFRK